MCIRNAMPQSPLCRAHSACSQLSDFCCGVAFAPLYSNPAYNDFIICPRMFAELEITYALVKPHRATSYTIPHLLCQPYSGLTAVHSRKHVVTQNALYHKKMPQFYVSGVVRHKHTAQILRVVRFVNRFISICFKRIYHIILRRCF